jgi:ribosome maturation protein Sdo1
MDTLSTISQRLYELAGEASHHARWIEARMDDVTIDNFEAVNEQVNDALRDIESTVADIHHNLHVLENDIADIEYDAEQEES